MKATTYCSTFPVKRLPALCLTFGLCFWANPLKAQTNLTWDNLSGDSVVTGGVGNWDVSTANWTTDVGLTNVSWVNGAPPNNAIFGGATGTVTVTAPITLGNLTFNSGYTLTGGTLTLSGTPTITSTADAAIASALAGTVGFTKLGAAQLTLSGANTFTGTTMVDNGTLVLGNTSGFAINGAVQMGNGSAGNQPNLRTTANEQFASGVVMTFTNPIGSFPRFDLQGTTQTLAGIQNTTGAGVIQNEKFGGGGTSGPATLTLNNTADYSYNGYMRDRDSGPGAYLLNLVKSGAGTQTLAGGSITYTGTTTINDGRLRLTDTTAFASNVTVNSPGTLELNTGGTVNFSRIISGNGNIVRAGTGGVILNGTSSNTFTGTFVVENGTTTLFKTGGAIAISGPVQMGAGVAGNQPNLRMGGNDQFGPGVVMTFVNPVGAFPRFDLLGTTQTLAGMQDTTTAGVTQNGGVGIGSAAGAVLTINNSANFSYNGYIRNFDNVASGVLGIIKTGAGTQTFSGGNITYTGTTTINNGTLALRDTTGFTSATTVNPGGTLSLGRTPVGAGSRFPVSGNAVVLAGGTLSIDNAGSGLAGGWTTFNAANDLTGSGTINIVTGVFSRDNTVANAINTSATVNVSAGAFFGAGRGGNSTIGGLNGAGVVSTLWGGTSSGSITIGNGDGSGSFSGTLDGNGTNLTDLTQQGGVLSVIKVGTGTQTFSGANTYSGTTTVNGGSLVIQNLASGSNNANLAGGKVFTTPLLNVASGATVVVDLGATSLASSNTGLTLSGAGTIQKNGAGIWWLGNGGGGTAISLAAGGLIDVQGGVLKNDYANANWSANNGNLNIATGASVDMRNNAVRVGALTGGGLMDNAYSSAQTLTVGAGNATGVFTGNVTQTGGGALSITKIGSGSQTLSGSGTVFAGTTTVSQGTLVLNGTNLVTASPWSIAAGANLTINYANTAEDTWVSGAAITGTGTLTKTGPGWFLFKGSAPANFQGSIVINGGRLGNGFNTTVWTNSKADVFVAAGAELDLRVDDMILDELTGSGTVINTYALGGSDTLSIGSNNGSSQFDGVIRGIGGVGANNTSIDVGRNNLTKIGTGTFTLTGASVYGGNTTVNNGVLRIGGSNNRLPIATPLIVNGGASVGGTFDLNSLNQTVGTLSGGSGVVPGIVTNLATGTGTLTVSGTSTFDGNIQDGGAGKAVGLTKSNNGTLTLTGFNTQTGPTLITGGALRQSSATALSPNSNIQLNGGIVDLGMTDFSSALGTGGGQIQFLGSGGFGAFGAPRNLNIGGMLDDLLWGTGNFVPNGSSLILSGPNSNDTVRLQNGLNLNGGAGRITSLGGTAAIDAELVGNISSGSLTLAPGDATFLVTGLVNAATVVENGATLTNNMQVVLQRPGGNAINGAFQIGLASATGFATVRLGADQQIADSTVVTFGAPSGKWSYLNLNGFNETVGGLSNLTGMDGGVVQVVEGDASPATNSTLTLNVTSGTQSYFGHIRDRQNGFSNHATAGKLNFIKTGAGTQELATWNNQTWSGTTSVQGGTLRLILNHGATLPGAVTVDATGDPNATLDLAPAGTNVIALSGPVSGNGTVVKTGPGTASFFNSTVSLTGNILVQQGTLRNDGNLTDWSASSANLDVSSGATFDMRADSVRLNALTGAGLVTNSFGNGVGVFDTLTIGLNGASSHFSGNITDGGMGSGDGKGGIGITKEGAGTQILSGNNTYSGITTIAAGTLQIGNGGTGGSLGTGPVVDNASLVFNRSDDTVASGSISGTGTLTKQGNGVLTLNTANTYGGSTTIAGGTVRLGASQTMNVASAIWLDAADGATVNVGGGGVLTSWTNKGSLGAAADAIPVAGQEPTFVSSVTALNSNAAIRFDADATGGAPFDRIVLPQNYTTGNVTIIYAGRLTGGANQRLVAGANNNWLLGTWNSNSESAYFNNGFLANSVAPDTAARIYTGTIATGGAAEFYVNGVLKGTGGGAQGPNGISLGGGYLNSGTELSDADIGEFLVFNGVLTPMERQQVQDYLGRKWLGNGTVNVLPATTKVTLTNSGAKLDINGVTQNVARLEGVSGTEVMLGNGGGSLAIGTDNADATFSGNLSGTGNFTKTGTGAQTMGGTNTSVGITSLTGGTLLLASNTALSPNSDLKLSTGTTLKTNGFSADTGAITLNANAGTAVIDMSGGNSTLTFADIYDWSGVLKVWNYDGGVWQNTSNDKLIFTANNFPLDLSTVEFYSGAGTGLIGTGAGFYSGTDGQLVPVPEPSAICAALALLGGIAYRERRTRRRDQN